MELNTGAVLEIFEAVQQSIKEMKLEIKQQRSSTYDDRDIQGIEMTLNAEIDNIADAFDRIEIQKDEVDSLKVVVIQHQRTIDNLTNKVIELERRLMEKIVVISGIKEKSGKNYMMEAQHFFRAKMRLTQDVPIVEAN